MIPNPHALLVVAKQPTPGQTKTRLCPPLTHAQAADLYDCFLRDTLDMMRKVPGVQCVIGYLPEDARGYFRQLAPDMGLICQRGRSLGERLDNLLTEILASGSQRAIVMDSDSPTLPVGYISIAFDRLTDVDVVLGPTRDGGYYLIGMKQPQPHLLRQVQMSTTHVLTDTLALAKDTGLTAFLLPTWYDVDTIADLNQLDSEISGFGFNGSAVATQHWLINTDWRNPKA
ncbi:MAG: TIGR04282 family arsenosugar biosynthesis glycosyltransferase [Anaerolineales bacterium]